MKRPDQEHFDLLARHFESIDNQLLSFGDQNGFVLEKNLLRQPNRVLRRTGPPEALIDLSLCEHWLSVEHQEDALHEIHAIAYFAPPDSKDVWRLSEKVVGPARFSQVCENLARYLVEALDLINKWTPEVIVSEGRRWENLKVKYGTS